ncbi:GerMN domain-containing protein [Paenibacillus harenae]|uniref:GerMN domain-containing protein n=1 Tax=Paenibacillus harenae TaxID=306543 RepID=UPI002792FE29|nr:GerMN domain-containing protein [Paenibacillus harenae]MDQ0058126.1 putative component of type VI protein secretion system [Paenibacillus harenae]
MTNVKARGLLAAFLFTLTLAGCGAQDKPAVSNGVSGATTPPSQEQSVPVKRTISVFSTDSELTKTSAREVEIELSEGDNELALVKSTLAELQKDGGKEEISLWKAIAFDKVTLEDDLVTVDILLPDEARLGGPGEMLAIESLTKTLFQFDFVNAVDILVDGEALETLMGHVELEHPYRK